MTEKNKINVLLVQPMKKPQMIEIGDSLEDMQFVVGGNIEEYMPFEDDVAIVCNEEGKMRGLELNRAIFTEEHGIQDIIAGDFFVCYAPIESESYLSLPPELAKKYEEKLKHPEQFFKTSAGIRVVPQMPIPKEMER